ncbi:MAG: diguanylate cyclase [Planctomycetes bacterium]|nr:diguanylate cyclase [Planctomycetota bacterium]
MAINPERIWSSPQLPTLPAVAVRLLELARDPEAEVRDVVAAIKADPAITARIIKTANSSFFALRSPVTSIERAVPLLGTTAVTSLALSFSVVDAAVVKVPLAEHYRQYWRQSVVQAIAADALDADNTGLGGSEQFLAGLLVDLGRLAMLRSIPNEYGALLDALATSDATEPLHERERRELGIDHIEVGLKLQERWKLPRRLADALEMHHASPEVLAGLEKHENADVMRAVAMGAAAGDYFCTPRVAPALERMQMLGARLFGFDQAQLTAYLERVKAGVDEVGEMFSIDPDNIPHPNELLAMANEELAQLALREHVASAQAVARSEEVERENRVLEERTRQLETHALLDPLTNVFNRRQFDDVLQRELDRARRYGRTIGVMFCDLDCFKQLNDNYGHAFGDEVLKHVSSVLKSTVRTSDTVARYGGEEFVVLAIEPTEKGIEILAERVRERVEACRISSGETPVPVTVSIGAVVALPRKDARGLAEQLLQVADEAMYEAKRSGRNQIRTRSLLDDGDRLLLGEARMRRFSRWLVREGVFELADAAKAVLASDTVWVRLGELAVRYGFLSEEQANQALQARAANERFGEAARRLSLLGEAEVAQLLALQQESPESVTAALVEHGQLDQGEAAVLLERYLHEHTPPVQRTAPVVPQPVEG